MNSIGREVFGEEGSAKGKLGRRRYEDYGTREFKSKNLIAERKRRQKLSDRQLELRALMNKATIITDAITYIEELQKQVKDLSDQLLEMEASSEEETRPMSDEINEEESSKQCEIKPEILVIRITENKMWIKMMYENKREGFIRLLETMSVLGLELTDISVTTTKGVILITTYIEASQDGRMITTEHIKELLLEIIRDS
ncbi:hypothetical protein RJ641_002047 [Dillenia turbinata]|uniref:BHLH domain-containing protein n=1 Tax=Dillenia turbinata TaxID=194707 RepID=A0AAN8VCF2_9MAGN